MSTRVSHDPSASSGGDDDKDVNWRRRLGDFEDVSDASDALDASDSDSSEVAVCAFPNEPGVAYATNVAMTTLEGKTSVYGVDLVSLPGDAGEGGSEGNKVTVTALSDQLVRCFVSFFPMTDIEYDVMLPRDADLADIKARLLALCASEDHIFVTPAVFGADAVLALTVKHGQGPVRASSVRPLLDRPYIWRQLFGPDADLENHYGEYPVSLTLFPRSHFGYTILGQRITASPAASNFGPLDDAVEPQVSDSRVLLFCKADMVSFSTFCCAFRKAMPRTGGSDGDASSSTYLICTKAGDGAFVRLTGIGFRDMLCNEDRSDWNLCLVDTVLLNGGTGGGGGGNTEHGITSSTSSSHDREPYAKNKEKKARRGGKRKNNGRRGKKKRGS